jgi:putative transposase
VTVAIEQHGISERRACRLTALARSTKRRRLKPRTDDALRQRMTEVARKRQRFGYRRITAMLRREGLSINHKRIYRLYCELGLAMRRRKRRHSGQRLAAAGANTLTMANQRWAMDFVSDTLAHGRTFRVLTIIDEHTRECLAMEADTSLPGLRVIRVLERLAETRGLPEEIHVDNVLNASVFLRPGAARVGTALCAVGAWMSVFENRRRQWSPHQEDPAQHNEHKIGARGAVFTVLETA